VVTGSLSLESKIYLPERELCVYLQYHLFFPGGEILSFNPKGQNSF